MDITESKIIEEHFSLLFELMDDGILFYDINGIITDINNKFSNIIGYSREKILGNHITDFLDDKSRQIFRQDIFNKNNQKSKHELSVIKKDGDKVDISISLSPIYDTDGCLKGNLAIITDITELKTTAETLKKTKQELESKTAKLEELNTALTVLVENNNKQKINMEKQIISNINELLYPYLIKLKNNTSNKKQKIFLNIIESNIKNITSSFSSELSFEPPSLTRSEHQILTLIKEGKSSKEIADLLCISERTVDTHRFHIRKKLGICRRKENLRSYLLSS